MPIPSGKFADVEGNNIFKLPVRRNREGFEIRVHQLERHGSTSFILWESSIGHFSKITSRANTVLSRKVDLREALCMLLRTSEYFLGGVPESPVHNVIIDFAHGGNIVRSIGIDLIPKITFRSSSGSGPNHRRSAL